MVDQVRRLVKVEAFQILPQMGRIRAIGKTWSIYLSRNFRTERPYQPDRA